MSISIYYNAPNSYTSTKYEEIVAYATKRIKVMHKAYQKDDLRVKRTKKLIFDAFIKCTIEKGFSTVTVSDITLTAGINRATFYRHYKDKLDLLNQYTQTVYDMLDAQKDKINNSGSHALPPRTIKIFEHIRENALFYKVMLGKSGDPNFAEKIRIYILKRIKSSLPNNLSSDKKSIDLFVNYSSHASFGAVLWWLEHDLPYSSEEMIRILQHLESENLKSILK